MSGAFRARIRSHSSDLPRRKSQSRSLHLAPPFLLDTHLPRYQLLSSTEASRKRSEAYSHLRNCNLCPRKCSVNRFERAGACLIQQNVRVGNIGPHFGEEPPIQGHNGSGSVFFSGCNMRCVFCQNHDIAHTRNGHELEPEALAEWMMKLQDVGGTHNINFITPEHVVPQVVLAILHAKDLGLNLPVVYNTSSYDSLESIKLLDGLVDIYLPDFKVWEPATARRLLKAADYAEHARAAIKAMHEQVGDLCFTPNGLAKSGLLVRHLVMPGHESEGHQIVQWLAREVSTDVMVHVMEQYSPKAHVGAKRRRLAKSVGKPPTEDSTANASKVGSANHVVEPGGIVVQPTAVRYDDINRPVEESEVSSVRKAAEKAGLWRFIDPAEHGGFNI